MKIIDCFMFYDEELLLDIRMNILNDFVDHFVIVESKYFHNGKERQLKFNINNYSKFKDKIIMFEQNIFYYKLNRYLPNFKWFGTKACKKKDLINPQWLRNIKNNQYSFFRLDTFFSNSKYINKHYIKDGGWHFSNLKNSTDIELKLKSYLHHHDYESEELGKEKIEELIKNNSTIYDMFSDKTSKKYRDDSRKKLEKFDMNNLPLYIQKNFKKYKEWID